MENKKTIELKHMLFDEQDLILVSVPTEVSTLCKYADKKQGMLGGVTPAGEIFELAVLNKKEDKFMLFRDLPENKYVIKIIHDVKDFVPKNSTGEFDFKRPNFVVEIPQGVSKIFTVTRTELEQGIFYDTLTSINKRYLDWQLTNYGKKITQQAQKRSRLQFLEECKEQYKDF